MVMYRCEGIPPVGFSAMDLCDSYDSAAPGLVHKKARKARMQKRSSSRSEVSILVWQARVVPLWHGRSLTATYCGKNLAERGSLAGAWGPPDRRRMDGMKRFRSSGSVGERKAIRSRNMCLNKVSTGVGESHESLGFGWLFFSGRHNVGTAPWNGL